MPSDTEEEGVLVDDQSAQEVEFVFVDLGLHDSNDAQSENDDDNRSGSSSVSSTGDDADSERDDFSLNLNGAGCYDGFASSDTQSISPVSSLLSVDWHENQPDVEHLLRESEQRVNDLEQMMRAAKDLALACLGVNPGRKATVVADDPQIVELLVEVQHELDRLNREVANLKPKPFLPLANMIEQPSAGVAGSEDLDMFAMLSCLNGMHQDVLAANRRAQAAGFAVRSLRDRASSNLDTLVAASELLLEAKGEISRLRSLLVRATAEAKASLATTTAQADHIAMLKMELAEKNEAATVQEGRITELECQLAARTTEEGENATVVVTAEATTNEVISEVLYKIKQSETTKARQDTECPFTLEPIPEGKSVVAEKTEKSVKFKEKNQPKICRVSPGLSKQKALSRLNEKKGQNGPLLSDLKQALLFNPNAAGLPANTGRVKQKKVRLHQKERHTNRVEKQKRSVTFASN